MGHKTPSSNQAHARAKRRRTRHVIGQYLRIWFQNRRQVSRRRSRPLTSDDFLSQQPLSSSFSFEGSSQDVVPSQESTPGTSQDTSETAPVQQSARLRSLETSIKDIASKNSSPGSGDVTLTQSFTSIPLSNKDESLNTLNTSTSTSASSNSIPPISKPPKASKTRHPSFTLFDESSLDIQAVAPNLPAPLKRTKSQPRLATSLDGSVRVKLGNSPTPSPPRPQETLATRLPRAPGSLQRSQSAMVTPTFPVSRSTASIGRSRDSRTWEFYCDSNARDELTKQAELEQSGSAVGAIGLIRSCSKGSVSARVGPTNPNKRNATVSKPDSGKRLKADASSRASKSKLARASSSVARLQHSTFTPSVSNVHKLAKPVTVGTDENFFKKKPVYTDLLDGNESDKENWAPGTQTSVTPRRTHQGRSNAATSSANILTENQHLPSLSSSLDVLLSRESSGNGRHPRRGAKVGTRITQLEGAGGKENEAELDGEVRGFMARSTNGSGENVIVGEDGDEEDLDCVEGLLRLSRGNWR
ncbi:MAG: hypothetical protein Q9213_002528 [Squamulea squamosa]